jgi:opacity protein-like surface antigen
MGRLKAIIGATLLTAAIGTQAIPLQAWAADMPGSEPLPVPERRSYTLEAFSSGWYLRGDIGYRWGALNNAVSAAPFLDPTDSRLGQTMVGTLGIGIKSRWLRTDLTVDVAGAQKYRGTIAAADDVTARIRTTSILFNGYFDLGSWYRLTPYVGAGAGLTNVRVSDYQSLLSPPFASTGSHSQWNFTVAGMAGVAWQVAPNVMIDLGYRYLNFGNAATEADAFGAMTFKNIAAHEVRLGVRWSFDDFQTR